MPSFSDHAIILKRTDFDEAKRIITLLTRNHGKISAIAPGVRKLTSRKGSHLELFNHAQVFLAKGKNLDIITEAATINSFENIRNNLEKIGQSYYIAELVDALLPEEQKNYRVFNLLLNALSRLNKKRIRELETRELENEKTNLLLRNFEIDLLKTLGFWSDKVHGRNYPSEPKAQESFNQILIQQIIERELKSARFLEQV